MLDYVRVHPRLSKGRHSEGSREERIGRGDTQICQELQQRKDRIINTLKRHLSPRGSGPRRKDVRILENPSAPPETSSVDSTASKLCHVNVPKFSMGGSEPRRKMGILWEKQFLFPEIDLHPALNELYPAELSSGDVTYPLELDANCHLYMARIETPPPEYNPASFRSAHGSPAQPSSGYYGTCDVRPPVISERNPVELDAGDGSSKSAEYRAELSTNDSMVYAEHPFPHAPYGIPELDTNDGMASTANDVAHGPYRIAKLGPNDVLTYAGQDFVRGCYEITELSANNGLLYSANTLTDVATQQQFDHSILDPSSTQENLNDWRQIIHSSSPPMPVVGQYDFNRLFCEQLQNSGTSKHYDLNELTPLVPADAYPNAYNVQSTESSISPDSLSGTSWFSSTPSLLSRTSSVSSLEFNATPISDLNDLGNLFFGESGHTYTSTEPNAMESLPSTPKDHSQQKKHSPPKDYSSQMDHSAQLSSTPGNWVAYADEDTFINGLRPMLISPSSIMSPQEDIQLRDQFQIPRKPVPSKSSSLPPSLSPDIHYSPRHEFSVPNLARSTPVRPRVPSGCTYCRRSFNDKSNLRRHEIVCKNNPLKNHVKYTCMYPRCGKEYARPDGLRFHQRGKGHEEKLEVFIKGITPPPRTWDQSPQSGMQTTELYSEYEWI